MKWPRRFIGHAGRPLYAGDHYGGMTLDPSAPRIVFDGSACEIPSDPTRPDVALTLQRSVDLAVRENVAVIRATGLPSTVADGYSLELPSAVGTARIGLPAEPIPVRVFAASTPTS